MVDEDDARCGLKEKGGAYFNRGAFTAAPASARPGGSWIVLNVYEDAEGRIGQRASNSDGSWRLTFSEGPSASMAEPVSAVWPRFPEGHEFGPEQNRE